jgi:hypothetical protein
MSEITDVLLARETTATRLNKEAAKVAKVAREGDPARHWPGFWVKHISTLDLANLYGILSNRFDDESVVNLCDEFEVLHSEGDDEDCNLVCSVPPGFVDLVAGLEEQTLQRAARKWRACEEFRGLYDQESMEEVLGKFRDLARKAKAEGRRILLRM